MQESFTFEELTALMEEAAIKKEDNTIIHLYGFTQDMIDSIQKTRLNESGFIFILNIYKNGYLLLVSLFLGIHPNYSNKSQKPIVYHRTYIYVL